jgi:hypothetical protein
MSGAIASYFATLGFRVERKELRKVDTTLKQIEDKLRRFGKKIDRHLKINLDVNKFTVDQKKLNLALGNALDLASARLVFQVSRFNVDQARLNAQMATAVGRASRLASARVNPDVGVRERLPRETIRHRDAIVAGGVGGLAARMYTPALGLALGGYGLGQVNRRNQEVVSAQLMTQAVVQQAGGTAQQGEQSFDWLRSQAQRVGFNYLDAAPDFNKLLSGLTGAGMSVEQGQNVFQGFAELSRVNKLDKTSQNRLFRALSQVAGKNQLMSEELTGQIAEALPGGVALFAEAYQRQIGGNLQGSEAIQALRKAMEGRQVKGDILIQAAQIASEKANKGGALTVAARASQAEQARFQNTLSDQAILASNAGVESGFARLFRSMTAALKEASPLVESMARGFDSVSLSVSKALLSIQSIQRFFQGRDSLLGDKLFPTEEGKAKAFEFLENLKTLMTELDKLSTNIYNGWSMLLDKLDNSAVIDKLNTTIATIANAANVVNNLAEGNLSGAMDAAASVGKSTINTITAPGRTGANAILSTFTDRRIPVPFEETDSQLDWATRYKAEQAKLAAENFNKYDLPGINKPLAQGQSSTNLEIKMDVEIKAANPEDFNQQFQEKFKSVIQDTLIQYSQKE